MNFAFSISILLLLFTQQIFANEFSITTYNLRNYKNHYRAGETDDTELVKILKEAESDISAFQEVVQADLFKTLLEDNFPHLGLVFSECGGSARQYLAISYNKNNVELLNYNTDPRLSMSSSSCKVGVRPALIATFKHKKTGIVFTVLNLHLKAGSLPENAAVRHAQYKVIEQILEELDGKSIENYIVLGDFNTTDYNLRTENYNKFISFLDENNLFDFAADLQCSAYWWGGLFDGIWYATLIDHLTISKSLQNSYHEAEVNLLSHCKKRGCGPSTKEELGVSYQSVSDHCPIQIKLKF